MASVVLKLRFLLTPILPDFPQQKTATQPIGQADPTEQYTEASSSAGPAPSPKPLCITLKPKPLERCWSSGADTQYP